MDPLSAAASVLTLISATNFIIKASKNLLEAWKDAPHHIKSVSDLLLLMRHELEALVQTTDHGRLLPQDAMMYKIIGEQLAKLGSCLEEIEAFRVRMQAYGKLKQTARWAIKDKQLLNQHLANLDTHRGHLQMWLHIMSVRGTTSTLTGIEELKVMVASVQASSAQQSICTSTATKSLRTVNKLPERYLNKRLPWISGKGWEAWGVRASVIPSTQGAFWDYTIALRLPLPSGLLMDRYALLMNLSLRTSPMSPMSVRLRHPSALAVARVVDQDSPFMLACGRGDLLTVRSMLATGEGRTTDVTQRNWMPLTFAIHNGHTDIVSELLDNGADVDATFGSLQTSPLQWAVWSQQLDVTRLLLKRGASQDHLNLLGWNVTFLCWPTLALGEPSKLDYLGVLSEDSYQQLDIVDTEGWSVLHRVSAYGTAAEVLELVRLGAKPEHEALPLRWTAIHHAVFYGNQATYEALLQYFEPSVMSLLDERGWTLLHIAASAGHEDIAFDLIKRGADPQARSRPFYSHIPEPLYGLACTPQEAAAAQGRQRELLYASVLRRSGVSCVLDHAEEDEEDEELEFWEAKEML